MNSQDYDVARSRRDEITVPLCDGVGRSQRRGIAVSRDQPSATRSLYHAWGTSADVCHLFVRNRSGRHSLRTEQ